LDNRQQWQPSKRRILGKRRRGASITLYTQKLLGLLGLLVLLELLWLLILLAMLCLQGLLAMLCLQ
jgi:hypothetical protein